MELDIKNNWRVIPGYLYEVSILGEVRNSSGRVLIPQDSGNGYKITRLSRPGDGSRKFYIHDLVLLCFIGPKPQNMETCHNNGKGCDNRLENLRYDTHVNNCLDRKRHGTDNHLSGEGAPWSKLTNKEVKFIRGNPNGLSIRGLARKFAVDESTVRSVIKNETWRIK